MLTTALTTVLLGGCHDTLNGPVDLFHNLQGGEIAAQRPPPPGAGLPYPSLGTVPAKPDLPNPAYRNGLQAQLLAERDRTQRDAADTPIPILPPPPRDQSPPPNAASPASAAAAPPANATLDTAEGPTAEATKPPAASLPDPGPPAGTKLTIVGDAAPPDGVTMPTAPPPPATFEGVPVEPAPTPHVLPAGLAAPPAGTPIFFANGSATLAPSQRQALGDFVSHHLRGQIEVIGLGEAASDTPDGQAAAITLGLHRAQAIQGALQALHVPPTAMRLGARAFGRGAVLRPLP